MNLTTQPVDMSKVRTVIYHMLDGQSYSLPVEGFEQYIELGYGDICDTSDIDGVIHFFPKGNA